MDFIKMHGLGNDFVIFDARKSPIYLTKEKVLALSHRNKGIGCDQVATINNSKTQNAKLEFWNFDGSKSLTCGNATRCIAELLFRETHSNLLSLETNERQIECKREKAGISINMGEPLLNWHQIPLSQETDTLELDLDGAPTATSMGNPHCTFFVENLAKVDISKIGKRVEKHYLFPEGTNVQFVEIIARDRVKAKIWERGVGLTLSSGSSSCAMVVAGVRRNLLDKKVTVELDGGNLGVFWADNGAWLSGPTTEVFTGRIPDNFFER